MGDAPRDAKGGDVSVADSQVLGVMETAFRASEGRIPSQGSPGRRCCATTGAMSRSMR